MAPLSCPECWATTVDTVSYSAHELLNLGGVAVERPGQLGQRPVQLSQVDPLVGQQLESFPPPT